VEPSDLPPYKDLLLPVLHAVQALGGTAHAKEVSAWMIENLAFDDDAVAVEYPNRPGESILLDRMARARSHDKLGGLIETPQRGLYILSGEGKRVLSLPDAEARHLVDEMDRQVRRARPRKKPKETPSAKPVEIAEIVDLDTYPIGEQRSERQRIVEQCRAKLADDGACQLDGFVRRAAAEAILGEAEVLEERAFRTDATHNPYFTELSSDDGESDPRGVALHSSKRSLGFKYFGAASPLRILYEWDPLVSFLKDVLQLPVLYRDADPLGACSVMFYDEGDELGWHFDNSEFAVTLMLQECLAGGDFEYVPATRTATDEKFASVRAVLDGARAGVVSLPAAPGALSLFRGRHSLHRVTPVGGTRRRINAVLAYASVPDHRLAPLTRRLFYGADEDD
jgi:alkylated DNA repair dioxygenase AlkB